MFGLTIWSLVAVTAAAGVTALVLLWAISRVQIPHLRPSTQCENKNISFLFRRNVLIDNERALDALPTIHSGKIDYWSDLRIWLGDRFGTLPTSLETIENGETVDFHAIAKDDGAVLTLSAHSGIHRVYLTDTSPCDPCDHHKTHCIDASLARFVTVLNHAPCAVRIYDPSRGTVWQNQVFNRFSPEEIEQVIEAATAIPPLDRLRLPGEHAGQDRCFDLVNIDVGEVNIIYLTDITQVAKAETVRREFIQTLTKTFANLTTGLAVFDRHRQLALFNPAVLDLTGLSPVFLSAQPAMTDFFDKLRDQKILPEPKNYGNWRNQIDTMITSASDGLYLEDWHLPNGLTYRITGRPHPDGAIAFLFEDISDEVALTRRYRGQIDMRQAALDACEQGIAVVGPNGVVVLCNQPCSELLGIDPDASFSDMSTADFVLACKEKLPDEAFWDVAEQRIHKRNAAKRTLTDAKGNAYSCAISPLRGNSTMIMFSKLAATETDHLSLLSATS